MRYLAALFILLACNQASAQIDYWEQYVNGMGGVKVFEEGDSLKGQDGLFFDGDYIAIWSTLSGGISTIEKIEMISPSEGYIESELQDAGDFHFYFLELIRIDGPHYYHFFRWHQMGTPDHLPNGGQPLPSTGIHGSGGDILD